MHSLHQSCLLFGCLAALCLRLVDGVESTGFGGGGELEESLGSDEDDSRSQRLLLGGTLSTVLLTTISTTTTSTVFKTCAQTVVTGVLCTGRKRKRSALWQIKYQERDAEQLEHLLEPSVRPWPLVTASGAPVSRSAEAVPLPAAAAERGARVVGSLVALTITSVSTSTLVISTVSTDSATTVSLSVYCTVPGATPYAPC